MSRCTPITAKAKQSPFKANASLIDGAAKVYGSVKGKDKEVNETKEVRKQSSIDFEQKCYNKDGSRKRGVAGCEWADEQGKESPKETETVTTTRTEPGEDLNYSKELKTAVKGDVFFTGDTRMQSRNIKKQYRDEKRAKIKAARDAGTLDRKKRKEIKAEISRKRAEEMTDAAKRGRLSRKSGLAPGSSGAYLYDRTVSLGERDPKEQEAQARAEAIRNNAKTNYFSESFEDFLNKPSKNSFSNYGINAAEKFMENTKRKGFPMRSGFKMKGYGKKK